MAASEFAERVPFLLGTWKGQGTVTSNGLKYNETSTFTLLRSEPAMIVNWQQFTKHSESGKPLHAENGFLKILPVKITAADDGLESGSSGYKAELMLSHPFSVNEFYKKGSFSFEGNSFRCEASEESGSFQRGPAAKGKAVTAMRREYRLDESGKLVYDIWLGVDGAEPKHHLHCELETASD